METHFNIQRRLYDYQFSLARTPAELEQRHQAFIQTYNTTAHQGLLKDQRLPPIPVEVLGTAKGRVYTPEELARHFSQARVPAHHQSVWVCHLAQLPLLCGGGLTPDAGPACGWPASSCGRCLTTWSWRNTTAATIGGTGNVKDIREGVFYPTRFASPQGTLIPLTPQDSVVVYRATRPGVGRRCSPPTPQLLLFEVVHAR